MNFKKIMKDLAVAQNMDTEFMQIIINLRNINSQKRHRILVGFRDDILKKTILAIKSQENIINCEQD